MCTWQLETNITLIKWTFVGKVMSLLFNTLSRFVIAFLSRSKCLIISLLQSPSAVILEPKKMKSFTTSAFPLYLPWNYVSSWSLANSYFLVFSLVLPLLDCPMYVCMLSCFSHVQLIATLWTVAQWTPLSLRFSRQKYWNGLPFPSPGHLPSQGSNPCLLCLLHGQAGSLSPVPPGKPKDIFLSYLKYGVRKSVLYI